MESCTKNENEDKLTVTANKSMTESNHKFSYGIMNVSMIESCIRLEFIGGYSHITHLYECVLNLNSANSK